MIVTCLIFVLAVTASTAAQTEEKIKARCGEVLIEVQAMHCNIVDKNQSVETTETYSAQGSQENDLWPWLTRRFVNAMSAAARKKHMAALIEKCCSRPCEINELLGNC